MSTPSTTPPTGTRWIKIVAIAALVVGAFGYVVDAARPGTTPVRTAIAEPGPTILPSVR